MTWTGAESQRVKNIEDALVNILNDYIVDYAVDTNITLTPIAINQYSINETSLDGNVITLNGSIYLLYAQTNLAENGIEDDTQECLALGIDPEEYIPTIHLYFDDDLTIQ